MTFDDDEIRHCCVSHRPERRAGEDALGVAKISGL